MDRLILSLGMGFWVSVGRAPPHRGLERGGEMRLSNAVVKLV